MHRVVLSVVLLCAGAVGLCADDEPLHVRIDDLISRQADGKFSPIADDAEFLRRVYLDLAGRIPNIDEASAFLDDKAKGKRQKLIASLLTSEDYSRHMAATFDVMLMERRGDNEEWTAFLQSAFAENKPWDRIAREILNPDAENESIRGAAFFYTKRLERYGQQPDDMPGLVRDVGRMFLGIDVQCAQCHDHLFIEDYKQADYQGLFAFVGQTFIRKDTKFPAVGEKPLTQKLEFASVFIPGQKTVGPKLPGGEEITIPEFKPGEEYLEPPDRKTKSPGVPKFSTLKLLSEQLPRDENPAFARNIVNRLWWLMTGRGLVEPLDKQHSGNPPTHPELLELLSREFVAHQFDIKWLLREIALTQTYQRSSRVIDANREVTAEAYLTAAEKHLSPKQILRSVLVASGEWERVRNGADGAPKYDDLLARFRKALALPEKEPEVEIVPSVKAALFFSNDSELLGLLKPREGNAAARWVAIDDPQQLADELYLTILSRPPTAEERQEIARLRGELADMPSADFVGLASWALLASNEFYINH